MTLRAALAALFLLLALAGCAGAPVTDLAALPPMPRQAAVADVPFYPQEERYCGPAALATVLAWSGEKVTQDEVAKEVYTPGRKGTLAADMVSGARRHGRMAVPVSSLADLLAEIAAGHPVIVFQNRGLSFYPLWHYAVAKGYDLDQGSLILNSGKHQDYRLGMGAFERTWRRTKNWALVVLPPGQLPATADVWADLAAAAALERVSDFAGADMAYAAIEARWPANWAVHFAIGNRAFETGDYEKARAAYREAVMHDETAAEAWNNLALALSHLGRRDEALDAARRAVAVGGADAGRYRATLDEIEGGSRNG